MCASESKRNRKHSSEKSLEYFRKAVEYTPHITHITHINLFSILTVSWFNGMLALHGTDLAVPSHRFHIIPSFLITFLLQW